MDKVFEYLTDRPDGASAEEIAREALGLRGAVGIVATRVVRAAAETDSRIVEGEGGQWLIHSGPKEKDLRASSFLLLASRSHEDGSLAIAATWTSFEEKRGTKSYVLTPGRSEGSTGLLNDLEELARSAVPAGHRFATVRNAINRASRFHVGRESLPAGLCLSRLARRCFPKQKIRTCADIAAALGLPYVEVQDVEALSRSQADLLLGLLERCEERGVRTIKAVQADLQPALTAVDFEAFAFDEDYLDDLPASPGVYVMRDVDGKVIYVGKSIHLRDRVRTYFAKRSERATKTLKILDRIWTVEVEEVGSELEALILEARLIQATHPEFNIQQELHERGEDAEKRDPFLVILPSSDVGSVELFCVRPDREICRVSVRKDMTDWAIGWSRIDGFLKGDPEELEPAELAAHRILQSWIHRNVEKVNLIDVVGAGESDNLRRLLEEHIREADDEAWEKVWRV
jgi:predicted GIY-YIG superfamily endonuclease